MKTYIAEKHDCGKTVEEYFKGMELDYIPLAYSINKDVVPHNTRIDKGDALEAYPQTHKVGYAVYLRSLIFLLTSVMEELLPQGEFEISHTISKGIYGCFRNEINITEAQVGKIKARLKELIRQDVPFQVNNVQRDQAIKILLNQKNHNEKWQYGERFPEVLPMYTFGGYSDYYYGPLVASTGLLTVFDISYYMPGLIIRLARRNNPDKLFPFTELPKIFDIIDETNKISDILEISYTTSLNRKIKEGKGKEIVQICEALQEQKIASIAKHISDNSSKYQLILISGPSSSGKTTFAKKLEIGLKAHGHSPISMSMDDFYLNRADTPLDKDGKPDFESVHAIDQELFQNTLASLINGETVELPEFNFSKGEREYNGNFISKEKTSPIIIEGIHGLNPHLTSKVPRHLKYIIYCTALTQVNMDPSTHIKTSDARLIRRIIRDNRDRSFDIERTLSLWSSVRKGEEYNIFKYQELADIHFNSNLPYELNVLKVFAEPLLESVPRSSAYYPDATALLEILRYFEPLEDKWVPSFSILRECIGPGE